MSAISNFKNNDKILIDANVLIYVFCPLNSPSYDDFVSHYTETLEKIYVAKSSIFVNSLIISEFINTWLRMDFKKTKLKNFKKDYRPTERYKSTIKSILRELEKFYFRYNVTNINDNFSIIDFQKKYKEYPESDFNDLIIAENTVTNKFMLLTQDNDFTKYPLTIIH